jgi:CBS domain-containing protein
MRVRNVSDCMQKVVYAVTPGTALEAVGRLFTHKHISGAPVLNASGDVIGVITSYDLIDPDKRHGDAHGTGAAFVIQDGKTDALDAGPVRTPGVVSDVMTAFVRSMPNTTPIDEAIRLMLSDDIHRVVILDDDRRVVGMFTTFNAMRALLPG